MTTIPTTPTPGDPEGPHGDEDDQTEPRPTPEETSTPDSEGLPG